MNDLLHADYERVGSLLNFLGVFHALKKMLPVYYLSEGLCLGDLLELILAETTI